jgi:hypothetical protein
MFKNSEATVHRSTRLNLQGAENIFPTETENLPSTPPSPDAVKIKTKFAKNVI